MDFIARVWSKPQTQDFIKRLRNAGYIVNKEASGYICHHKRDETGRPELVFRAMVGHCGYLCRVNKAYVSEVTIPLDIRD